MIRTIFFFIALCLCTIPSFSQSIAYSVEQDKNRLVSIYKHVHAHPELPFQEIETAKFISKELKQQGFKVYQGIGRTGVVGILKNGKGPTIMLRSDMDGLPVKEDTSLSYKSKVVQINQDGESVPVMHACGHDSHITWMIGIAKQLAQNKKFWHGTAILVAQPAEEILEGAKGMVKDGLYKKIPKPDLIISGHNMPFYPIGSVALSSGRRLAGTDNIEIIIHGKGGHGSAPNMARDPIVMGAMAVMNYQSIVARNLDQYQPSVLTVGSFHAGLTNNVIPDSAQLKLNLRWYRDQERKQLITGIQAVTDSIAHMNHIDENKMPEYRFSHSTTPVINPVKQTNQARTILKKSLGATNVLQGVPPIMASEDFHLLAGHFRDIPTLWIEIGAGTVDAYKNYTQKGIAPQIMNHNPQYVAGPDVAVNGTIALTTLMMGFLQTHPV